MKFLRELKEGTKLSILNKNYDVIAMNYYLSEGDKKNWYAKILLNNKHCLCVNPKNNKTIDFGYEIAPIAQGEIFPKTIKYDGKEFKFAEKDYQFVKKQVFGDPIAMEGECLFTNHINPNNETECVSMGYIPRTKSRADIYLKTIPFDKVKIIK